LMLLVHHTDPEHEYAYGENATVGRLSKALLDEVQNPKSGEPPDHRWIVVDMQKDWKRIYKFGNVTLHKSTRCEAK
ncbi:MAG TPA: hypothetical protein VEF07_06375, partial [Candidatus Binataceae bacterium]|nr:hypothetical protein [Candidatus Binataceae bacterium]